MGKNSPSKRSPLFPTNTDVAFLCKYTSACFENPILKIRFKAIKKIILPPRGSWRKPDALCRASPRHPDSVAIFRHQFSPFRLHFVSSSSHHLPNGSLSLSEARRGQMEASPASVQLLLTGLVKEALFSHRITQLVGRGGPRAALRAKQRRLVPVAISELASSSSSSSPEPHNNQQRSYCR